MYLQIGEKPFSCKVCKKAFAETGNLNKHMIRHHGNQEEEKVEEEGSLSVSLREKRKVKKEHVMEFFESSGEENRLTIND